MAITPAGSILSEPVMSPGGTRPEVTRAPLPIHGVAPGLRDAVERAGIAVPPEPQPATPSWQQIAKAQREAYRSDKDWVAKHLRGDPVTASQQHALIQIELSTEPEEILAQRAAAAGLTRPAPPLPPAPPPNPMQRTNAQPSDYAFSRDIRPQGEEGAKAMNDARAWAAGMKFHPGLGNAILDRVARVEAQVSGMDYSSLSNWDAAQDRQLVSKAGSVDAARALREDARRALHEMSGTAWGKTDAAVLNEAWLVLTLANHWRAHAASRGIK
jgi:hypothetical protein